MRFSCLTYVKKMKDIYIHKFHSPYDMDSIDRDHDKILLNMSLLCYSARNDHSIEIKFRQMKENPIMMIDE